ncbi:unnamed protein product [Thelazia callipaeda]|uniref:WIF domain-containing protein n=1 Tax=Thelazia callipaeda TaxID=103827 RepID=A0A0N5DAZ5_THECL|nr:unnamed protein product [Thelazia callipaeda]
MIHSDVYALHAGRTLTMNCDYVDISNNDTTLSHNTTVNLAYDIRVEPFARAITRFTNHTYQLSVDISWQMPPNSSLL